MPTGGTMPRRLKVLEAIKLLQDRIIVVQGMQSQIDAMQNKAAAVDTHVSVLTDLTATTLTKLSALQAQVNALPNYSGAIADINTALTALTAKVNALPNYAAAIAALQAAQPKNYEGVTNAQGTYSVTFTPALAAVPYVQVEIFTTNPRDVALITRSAGSVSVTVQRRNDIVGLLPTYAVVAGVAVVIQVTTK